MDPLCRHMMEGRPILYVCLSREHNEDALEFLSPIISFLSSIVSRCVPSSLSVALYHPSAQFQRNVFSCFLFFFLPRQFISVWRCLWGLNEASLTGPSTDSRLHAAAATIE